MTYFRERPHFVPCVVAGVLCLIAIADWPYAYYTVLRVVTSVSAAVAAWVAVRASVAWAVWVLGVVALLFNPIVPVHLTKEVWRMLDATAGIALLLCAVVLKVDDRDRSM
ncbi:MAG: hypothetical protein AMXMBFR61_05740 [Fimbriimonadales bacterium]